MTKAISPPPLPRHTPLALGPKETRGLLNFWLSWGGREGTNKALIEGHGVWGLSVCVGVWGGGPLLVLGYHCAH